MRASGQPVRQRTQPLVTGAFSRTGGNFSNERAALCAPPPFAWAVRERPCVIRVGWRLADSSLGLIKQRRNVRTAQTLISQRTAIC